MAMSPMMNTFLGRCGGKSFLSTVALAMSTVALLSLHLFSQRQAIKSYTSKLVITNQMQTGTEGMPSLVWLLHYPKTGAKYTQMLIHKASRTTTATNYGNTFMPNFREWGNLRTNDHTSIPVYPGLPGGPFRATQLGLPKTPYVLAQTSCARFCHYCEPKSYVPMLNDAESFLKSCATGKSFSSDTAQKTTVYYDPGMVKRALHLVRDPYDVIVSRFRDERAAREEKGDEEFLSKYPSNPVGFQSFCQELDFDVDKMRTESEHYTAEEFSLAVLIPCHAEFYRYLHWLDMAFEMSREMRLPILVVHYADYRDDLSGTVEQIFNFLELEMKDSPPDFTYDGGFMGTYYTPEQKIKVKEFVELVSTREVVGYMERYFERFSVAEEQEVVLVD